MLNFQLTVSNELGLHARAAAQLVKCVSFFDSTVTLNRPGSGISADGRSILSILALAATKGTVLDISIDGSDENAAKAAVERAFAIGFSESSIQPQ